MHNVYKEAIAQIAMRPFEPSMGQLPSGMTSDQLLVDPTFSAGGVGASTPSPMTPVADCNTSPTDAAEGSWQRPRRSHGDNKFTSLKRQVTSKIPNALADAVDAAVASAGSPSRVVSIVTPDDDEERAVGPERSLSGFFDRAAAGGGGGGKRSRKGVGKSVRNDVRAERLTAQPSIVAIKPIRPIKLAQNAITIVSEARSVA